jgi:cystathionine beta-lyase
MNSSQHKATLCIHAGIDKNLLTEGVNTPVFNSSAINFMEGEEIRYPRNFNTINQKVVADKVCALEKAEAGLLFGSGMAAISNTVLSLLQSGDHILLQRDLYGGTYQMATKILPRFGISYSLADPTPEALEAALRPETRMIYVETPSNPLLRITDLAMISSFAKAHGLLSMIDNTFASPINQNPIAQGIDIVMHSGSKYLGGHSDLLFGVVLGSNEVIQQVKMGGKTFGSNVNASTASLIERSIKTLAVRMRQHNENAQVLAEYLQQHPQVQAVYYPGLPGCQGHETARRQMHGFGGMLSFEPRLKNIRQAEEMLRRFNFISPAVSLGGVETLVNLPARTSHSLLPPEERVRVGVKDVLMRVSVGIEEVQDIIDDLEQALDHARVYAVH